MFRGGIVATRGVAVAAARSATAAVASSPVAAPMANVMSPSECVVARRAFSRTHSVMGVDVVTKLQGAGPVPTRGQKVTVHCTGYIAEGRKKFWSTKDKNEPFTFPLGVGQVIRGWDEGVAKMRVGETAELTTTSDYAYGPKGYPLWNIGPNATLIFDIELLSIK